MNDRHGRRDGMSRRGTVRRGESLVRHTAVADPEKSALIAAWRQRVAECMTTDSSNEYGEGPSRSPRGNLRTAAIPAPRRTSPIPPSLRADSPVEANRRLATEASRLTRRSRASESARPRTGARRPTSRHTTASAIAGPSGCNQNLREHDHSTVQKRSGGSAADDDLHGALKASRQTHAIQHTNEDDLERALRASRVTASTTDDFAEGLQRALAASRILISPSRAAFSHR